MNHIICSILCLNSFDYMSLKLISLVPCISTSYLWWLKKPLLYGYITICLFIHWFALLLPFSYCE